MAQPRKKINEGKPLTALQIKHILLERGQTIVGLAALASGELGRSVSAWQVKAVIYRYPGVVYADLRAWLAGWIGCAVSQVGREPLPRKAALTEAPARATA